MVELRGKFAPLPTPYTDDASTVSEVRLARVMRHLLALGVHGFVVNAEMGEFFTCSFGERKSMVEYAIRDSQGNPVLVNVSTLSTAGAIDLTQHAARHGARGVICQPPLYGKYTDTEVIGFFHKVAGHGGLPVMVVDPDLTLTDGVKAGLQKIGGVELVGAPSIAFYGDGRTHTDEFEIGHAVISPLATLALHALDSANLANLFHGLAMRAGSARLGKAAMELIDLDCGPHRGPFQGVTPNDLRTLHEVMDMCREDQL